MLTVHPSKRKWWVLVAVSSALAMVFVDQSALPIALPSIQRELHFSSEMLNWVINAYVLTLAVLIILGGKLGDKLGHRNVFLSGMIIFISSSILCAMAPTAQWLIAGRVLQGVGGAIMMPSSSPLFRTTVSGKEFGRMAGLYVAIASVFLIIGPSLGGFLTAYLSWRWIFWINFPIALISILIILFVMPHNITEKTQEKGFDWQGFLAVGICLMALVFALMQGQVLGWDSAIILSCLAVFIMTLGIFLYVELRHPHPFIDLKMFKNDCFSRCVSIITAIQIVYMSIIFWALFLQYSLSLSPQQTGVFLLAAQVPVLFSSPLSGRMLDRYGPRLPVSLGTLLIAVASLWIAIFCWRQEFRWLFPALIVFGIASPMVNIAIMSTVVSSAAPEKRGIASGIISASRQVGGSVGLAILVAIITYVTQYHLHQWIAHANGALAQLTDVQLNALLAGTVPANQLTAVELQAAHTAAVHAYTWGFSCAMFVVATTSFLAYLAALKLPKISKLSEGQDNG